MIRHTLSDAAREALYAVGFNPARPSFRTCDTRDGAVVEILGEIAAAERLALAMDTLRDLGSVSRDGAHILVRRQSTEVQVIEVRA